MKQIKMILIILLLTFTTSCYNYVEVNEIAIVEGIAIDYLDNKYQLILEIIDIKTDNENSYLIEEQSPNLNEAFNKVKDLSSKKISMSHLETVILSKNVLLNHIDDIANYFINQNDITTNFYLVYSNNPKEILTNKNNYYPINTKTITDNLDKDKNKKYQFDYIYTSIKEKKIFEIPKVSLEDNNIKIEKETIKDEKWYSNKFYY